MRVVRKKKSNQKEFYLCLSKKEMHRAPFSASHLPLPPEESQTILAKCLAGWYGTDVAVKV